MTQWWPTTLRVSEMIDSMARTANWWAKSSLVERLVDSKNLRSGCRWAKVNLRRLLFQFQPAGWVILTQGSGHSSYRTHLGTVCRTLKFVADFCCIRLELTTSASTEPLRYQSSCLSTERSCGYETMCLGYRGSMVDGNGCGPVENKRSWVRWRRISD